MIPRKIALSIFTLILLLTFTVTATAHPGSTDEDGGHIDQDTGEYHYHHGHPAHDHYDIDDDGEIDCPYNFEYEDDHEDEEDDEGREGVIQKLIPYGISLLALIVTLLLNALIKHLDENDQAPLLQKVLFAIMITIGIVSMLIAAAGLVVYVIIRCAMLFIRSIICKYRKKKCKEYAKTLLSIIENPQFESCAADLLRTVESAVHNKTEDFKPPFEHMVQKTIFQASNDSIKWYIKSESNSHTESYYLQMRNIRLRLGQILQVKDL